MSARHRRRSPFRLWWTVAAGNAALGIAVLTAVLVSSAPGAPVDRTTSASVATATNSPLVAEQTGSGVGDGWATAVHDGSTDAATTPPQSASSDRGTTSATDPSTAGRGDSTAPTVAAGTTVSTGAADPTTPTVPTGPRTPTDPRATRTSTPTETSTPTGTTTPSDTTTPTDTATPTDTTTPSETTAPEGPITIGIPPVGGVVIPPIEVPSP